MSETGIRLLVIAAVLLLGGVAAVTTSRTKRARPARATRDDLPPGVHLFTSATCATCTEARTVIASTYRNAFTETRFEDDPQSFGHHGIARVPTAIIVLSDGTAWVFEGVPRRRDLPLIDSGPTADR
jgi:hypothetical protein